MRARQATLGDLDAIMRIEAESFGEVGAAAMATRLQMADRIALCNGLPNNVGWFLVAEMDGAVCGYLSLQPTDLLPEDCVSWESSTDNGTFRKTYNPSGQTIFGASLATGANAPPGATDVLIHHTLMLWWKTSKKRIMFCSRLPGLADACANGRTTPEKYWCAKDKRGAPRDPLLKVFYHYFGVGPHKFLRDGFLPDTDSCGHGALILIEDPFYALTVLPEMIYKEGAAYATTHKGEKHE